MTAWWQLDDSLMTAWRQLNIFHTNFHAKSGLGSSKNEWVMLNLVFGSLTTAWWQLNIFHTNFHTKSGLCSSRNEWVMLNVVFGGQFFGGHFVFWNLFGLSIQTSMQNLDSVAQEMSELCSILRFGGHFVYWRPFLKKIKICSDCPYELPCKIWTL